MFKGAAVALVTPMKKNGQLDFDSLEKLVAWQLKSGTQALVVKGTTGESPSVLPEEKKELIQFVVGLVNGKVPVIAGTGTHATQSSIEQTQVAQEAGANAAMLVTPYYNKPTQEGLFEHFKAVASATDLPIILYNVPSRTACDCLPETVAQLAQIKNIIAIKDASGFDRFAALKKIKETIEPNFLLYTGEDEHAYDWIKAGGDGVISVTGNVAPGLMHQMCQALLSNQNEKAIKLSEKLDPLHQSLFLQSNPIPVKWALQKLGKIGAGIRLPLTELAQAHHGALESALVAAGCDASSS